MPKTNPLFDISKAKITVDKGRRKNWWRRKGGKASGFYYTDAVDKKITNSEHLERIRDLVIPPAWKHVRIAPTGGARLQAVGVDTNGRVQYLYHSKFSAKQQRIKFSRIQDFATYLPQLRNTTNKHIALDGFTREKVLAVMLRLINSLYFRVGTDESAKKYRTFGITTLQNKHLKINRGGELVFEFAGKSHVHQRKVLVDEELAALLKEIAKLGIKRKLFHYIDDEGRARGVKPSDINRYLKEATAPAFSSKDLRTWGGTLLAAVELAEVGVTKDAAQMKKNVIGTVKKVAEELGNTPAVCRSSYIHPDVITSYENGKTLDQFQPKNRRLIKRIQEDYEVEELALIKLFESS